MASKKLEGRVAAQKRRNCYRVAERQFSTVVAEAKARGLTVKFDVPSEEDFLAGRHSHVSGHAFRRLHDFQRACNIDGNGFRSAPYQDSWNTDNMADRLRQCFEAHGLMDDEVYLLFDFTSEWLELTAGTLLAMYPHIEDTDWFWHGGDRAVLEKHGRWCCYLNRHGTLGFGFHTASNQGIES